MEREAKKIQKEKEADLKKNIREQQLQEVQGKIQQKKDHKQKEEQRIAAEVKETRLRQQYMNANQAMVEEQAWKSQQDGLEREIKDRQNSKLIQQERVESINMKERKILAQSAKKMVQTKVEFNKEYDQSLKQAQTNNEKLFEDEFKNKTKQYQDMKHWQMEHTNNQVGRDQFKQKISEMSLEKSKKKKQTKSNPSKQENLQLPAPQYQQQAIPN